MESASAFWNGPTTTDFDDMDLDFGVLREFFDIDLAGLSPTIRQSDFPAGSDVNCVEWNSRQLSTTHNQSGDLGTNTIAPEQVSFGRPNANDFGGRVEHHPFNFTDHNSSSRIQHENTLSSALSTPGFDRTTSEDAFGGTDLRICEQEPGLESFVLPDIEMLAELDMSLDRNVGNSVYTLPGNIPKNVQSFQGMYGVTHPQPTAPSQIELQSIYEELQSHKRTMDHVLTMVSGLCNRDSDSGEPGAPPREAALNSPQKRARTPEHYPEFLKLDNFILPQADPSGVISGGGISSSSLPVLSTKAQQHPSRKRRRVGRLAAHEVCDSSWLVAPSRSHIQEQSKIERRPRTNLVKNPCFLCRLHKKKCSGQRPCEGCLAVDYRKSLQSLEPCVALDENPFRFWTGNTLFNIVIDDENLFRLARIPNPLRKLEVLWFIDNGTIESGLSPPVHLQSIRDVRSFGTHLLNKMNKWRDFSKTSVYSQFLFILTANMLIQFFMEVVKLSKQAARIDLFRQTDSGERIETFIKSSLRCVEQLLVPRTILTHKAQLSPEQLQFAQLGTDSWQLIQDGCELQFETIVEQSIVYTHEDVDAEDLIFTCKTMGHWVYECTVGGRQPFGILKGQANTPLHEAVAYNNLFALQILLGRRARTKRDGVWHPIPWNSRHYRYVNKIQQKAANQWYRRPRLVAITFEEDGTEKEMLSATDVNAANDLEETPLHLAARFARPAFIEILIQEGAAVNALDLQGKTPLHYVGLAVFANELDVRLSARLLCEAGTDLSIRSLDGMTAIQGALLGGAQFLQQISSFGIDMESQTVGGDTILHIAVREGASSVVEILIEAGANIYSINHNAETPLHLAAERGDLDVAKCLVRAGADLHSRNSIGDTPLHIAAAEGNLDMCEYLVYCGCNVNAIDKSGRTPLHAAVLMRAFDTARYLLNAGANPYATNNAGNMAWPFPHAPAIRGVSSDNIDLKMCLDD